MLNDVIRYIDKIVEESKDAIEEDTGNEQFDNGYNAALIFIIRKFEILKKTIEKCIFLEQNK